MSARVAIVGAGPAGTAAAIEVQRAGLQAVLIDKARFPRDKCCGDGLTTDALRQLEHLGVAPAGISGWQPVREVVLRSPKGNERRYALPAGPGLFAATAPRSAFDAALLDRARADGAEVHEGTAVAGIELFDDRVAIATDQGPIDASWCIAADGMWSPIRKALGLTDPGYRGEWHAFRQYWRSVSGPAASRLHVWFEPDVLPGYVWSFPLPGGRANVGFGVSRRTHAVGDMGERWRSILTRPHILEALGPAAEPEGPHRAWPIPARVGRLPLTAHRTFFVGDAAAACDPMTGEGIAQAMLTGRLAAQAISGATAPPVAASSYERAVERELAIDMRFAGRLARILENPTRADLAVRVTAKSDWTSRNFVRWLFEDYPRAILATPARWRLGLLSRPGAYVARSEPYPHRRAVAV